MKIIINVINLDLTRVLREYIEMKLAPLAKFVGRFDEMGSAELRVEISRTTRHHKHGDVFWAAADLRLPKKILRAEAEAPDARAAINIVKNTLRIEIEKYRTRFLEPKRGRGRRD